MMRGEKKLLLLILIFWFRAGFAQNDSVFTGKELSSFKLIHPVNGKIFHLTNKGLENTFSLFVFLSPECPLSQNYLPVLNSLKEKFGNRVLFYGIIPGKAYSNKMVNEFSETYSIQFPLLIDRSKSLTNYLHAQVTPEIILLDNKNLLVYKGAVDDLVIGLGKRKTIATNEYLKDALSQSINHKAVFIKRTRAVGCKINDY